MDAGPFGSGHQHEDKLHLVASAYGRPLLVDAGNYMYDRSRWRRYVLSTRGHNTIRVDGQDQNRRADRATWVLPEPFQPLDNLWATRPRSTSSSAGTTSGYGAKRAIQVTHTRAVVFVKPDYWVVVDTLHPPDDREHATSRSSTSTRIWPRWTRTEPLWSHGTPKKPTSWSGRWQRRKLGVAVVKGIKEEPVQGWANGPWRPVPTAVITGKGTGTCRMATVLYPLAPGAACPIRSVSLLAVTTNDKPSNDTLALRLSFANGQEHTLLVADGPGVRRQCDGIATEAQLFGRLRTTGSVQTFQYP